MFVAGLLATLVALVMIVGRALRGPTVLDRLVAGNSIGTCAILLLALLGFLTGRPEFLDIGITYALLNVISTVTVLKFFRYGPLGEESGEDG